MEKGLPPSGAPAATHPPAEAAIARLKATHVRREQGAAA